MTLIVGSIDESLARLSSNELNLKLSSLPVKYLGLLLCSSTLNRKDCAPLLERIKGRIKIWYAKLLSFLDRLELIKSVPYAFCVYWLSAFVLPKYILLKVNSLNN